METKLNAKMKGQQTRCIDCHMPGTANTGGIAGDFGRMIKTPPYANAQEEENNAYWQGPLEVPCVRCAVEDQRGGRRRAAGPGDADSLHRRLRDVPRRERVAVQVRRVPGNLSARNRRVTVTAMLLALLVSTVAVPQPGAAGSGVTYVVFVCEHGAAKSLIAAAYFNKLAAERGLTARATFRGVDPQDALSMGAVAGLKDDGVAIPFMLPDGNRRGRRGGGHAHLRDWLHAAGESRGAVRARRASWDDVPDDRGYRPMRDAIVRHVRELLDTLR